MNKTRLLISSFAATLAAGACATSEDADSANEVALHGKVPPLNEELSLTDQAGEPKLFERLGAELADIQRKHSGANGGIKRGFHPKPHACVMGELQVLEDRPEATKFGVFATTKKFKTWVRLSNAKSKSDSDHERDIRGLAVKVLGVPGTKLLASEPNATTQDFLAVNTDTLGVRNAELFMLFQKVVNGDLGAAGPLLLQDPFIIKRLLDATHPVESMFKERFWSGVPFKLGPRASKFSFTPCGINQAKGQTSDSARYLREDAVKRIEQGDSCFDLSIQFQRDAEKQPVEDSQVSWKESEAPFVRVARLVIPKQEMHSDTAKTKEAFCENLVWNPWHALPEHRPIGNANRARKIVMVASQKLRGAPQPPKEPTGNETF
jgi:Catalase